MSDTKPAETPAAPTPEVQPAVVAPAPKKSNSAVIIIIVLLLVLCVCCSVMGGAAYFVSRNAENLAKAALDQAKQKAQDQIKNDLNNNGGSTTGNDSSNTGSDSGSGSFSFDDKLPAGFPNDVPIYPNSKVGLSSSDTKNGKNEYFATLTVKGNSDEIVNYYKSALGRNGWKITGEYNFLGASIVAEKDNRETTVVVFGDNNTKDQTITLSVTYK